MKKILIFLCCLMGFLACHKETANNGTTTPTGGGGTKTDTYSGNVIYTFLETYPAGNTTRYDSTYNTTLTVTVKPDTIQITWPYDEWTRYKTTVVQDSTLIAGFLSSNIYGFSGHYWKSSGYFYRSDSLYLSTEVGVQYIGHSRRIRIFKGKKN